MSQPQIGFKAKIASRKFVLMLSILLISTGILLLPSFMNFVAEVALAPIMSGGEFVTLIIGAYTIYSGANVIDKRMAG